MDTLLIVVSTVSLLAAMGAGIVAWRLRAEERRRSEARVAALSSAIDMDAPARPGASVAVSGLFAPEHSPAAHGIPLLRVAVAAIMAIVVIIAVAMSGGRGEAEQAAVQQASGRSAAPLELLSMRHEREGDTLRVSGLLRNPPAGVDVARVAAVVLVFDRSGAYVASGRAALDFTTLAPGDESPFVVTIPGVAEVGRYRVSFRTESGGIRHVDRRAAQMRLAAAANSD